MAENKEIKEIRGVLKQKKEATTRNGKPYFQMLIGNTWISLWDTKLAEGINKDSRVVAYYTQTTSGDKTFNNMTAIELDEEVTPNGTRVEKIEVEATPTTSTVRTVPPREETKPMTLAEGKAREADKYELGMAKNNASMIISAMIQAIESNEQLKSGWAKYKEMYWSLVKELFEDGREIRKEKLGY